MIQTFNHTCEGLAGDIPCDNVDQLSFINFADMGYTPVASDSK
jgi:hypothetical protein